MRNESPGEIPKRACFCCVNVFVPIHIKCKGTDISAPVDLLLRNIVSGA
uniref:Uncharacterized protein n=1 Tax=Anguilla anguilla TaxID=7936 RepID=A0A0E9R053_ANGAN